MSDDHQDHDNEDDPTETSPLLPKSDNQQENQGTEGQGNSSSSNNDQTSPLIPRPVLQQKAASIGPPIDITPNNVHQGEGNAAPKRQDTQSWPVPAGLPPREEDDESLVIFRRAVGINYTRAATDPVTMEEGRKKAVGIYRAVIKARHTKMWQFRAMWCVVLLCHFAQIIIGAALTALGPLASDHSVIITVLGATNTVIAGLLALVSGQGIPDRIQKDEVGYRKIQDWIEETESLLSVGIIGRNRKEVGLLVEEAFKKYNAARSNEENNRPTSYVNAPEEPSRADADSPRPEHAAPTPLPH